MKVLTLFWNLAHSPDVPNEIIDQAMNAHVKILDYSGLRIVTLKKQFGWIVASKRFATTCGYSRRSNKSEIHAACMPRLRPITTMPPTPTQLVLSTSFIDKKWSIVSSSSTH
jgi:hypothetical protein